MAMGKGKGKEGMITILQHQRTMDTTTTTDTTKEDTMTRDIRHLVLFAHPTLQMHYFFNSQQFGPIAATLKAHQRVEQPPSIPSIPSCPCFPRGMHDALCTCPTVLGQY